MWPSHLLFMEISTECMCLRAWRRAFLYIRMCFLLHIRLHAAVLQDIYIIYSSHFTFLTLFSHLILIYFLTSHPLSRSLTSSWHSCFFGGKRKERYFFFIILASLCSLLLVYINIVLICVIESAHKSNTNVVLWGSFSFLITAIVCTLYTISTFTFSFPSSALNRHCSLSLCAQSFEKYEKKYQQIHLQGEEEKWWKTCDSLVCLAAYIFHKAHSSFESRQRRSLAAAMRWKELKMLTECFSLFF